MAEVALEYMPAHNSLDRPVGFHWLAIVDTAVEIEIDSAVAGTAVADIAAVVDIAAGTVVVDSFVAAANRRLG